MNDFVFLYRSPPALSLSPQQMQDRMHRWNAWFRDLERKGALASLGQPLAHSGGGVVRDKDGSHIDGPFAETKDIVIGFSVIRANSYGDAVSLAAACPVFDQDGALDAAVWRPAS